jgi:hypothetical protein
MLRLSLENQVHAEEQQSVHQSQHNCEDYGGNQYYLDGTGNVVAIRPNDLAELGVTFFDKLDDLVHANPLKARLTRTLSLVLAARMADARSVY